MNCNDFIAFFFFKDTHVFKGVLGYGSIVHLRDMILSSVLQTQPTNQHKKIPRHCHNSKCYDYFIPAAELWMLLMAAEKANSPTKLIFMKAGNEKSLLKVTLAPGSAHTDIPIITAQKGLCVWKPENISSLYNCMFHSREHYVGFFFFFCKLSKCIHNSTLSLWCRNTVKKMNTAI